MIKFSLQTTCYLIVLVPFCNSFPELMKIIYSNLITVLLQRRFHCGSGHSCHFFHFTATHAYSTSKAIISCLSGENLLLYLTILLTYTPFTLINRSKIPNILLKVRAVPFTRFSNFTSRSNAYQRCMPLAYLLLFLSHALS